jgi:hypothetical protein
MPLESLLVTYKRLVVKDSAVNALWYVAATPFTLHSTHSLTPRDLTRPALT